MNRNELEHLLRASAGVSGESEFYIFGSQSILGRHPDAPRALRQSMELDLCPRTRREAAEAIEAAIGELSQFHHTHGVYVEVYLEEEWMSLLKLPLHWKSRLVKVSGASIGEVTGWCLDPLDLAYAKLAAAREKDLLFVQEMFRAGIISIGRLTNLINAEGVPGHDLEMVAVRARRLHTGATE